MPWFFFIICVLIAVPTGFATFSNGAFFKKKEGKIVQGIMSLICFGLMALAFSRYSWKIGLATVILIFAASTVGLSILKRVSYSSDLQRVKNRPSWVLALNVLLSITWRLWLFYTPLAVALGLGARATFSEEEITRYKDVGLIAGSVLFFACLWLAVRNTLSVYFSEPVEKRPNQPP